MKKPAIFLGLTLLLSWPDTFLSFGSGMNLYTAGGLVVAVYFMFTPSVSAVITQKLIFWSGERQFSFAETKLAASEPHLSLMQNGAVPVKWGWWVNSPQTFDPPLIALTSRDRKKTIALAFERAIWASSNTGDDRACFHLFPWFGRIEPGQSVTVRGRLYVLRGGPQEAIKRFRKDFPKLTATKAPLGIQLPTSHPPSITGHVGLGETNAPDGRTLWADNRSLYRNGKPWMPVMGEFHFTRCPQDEWRDALLKMKAGGVDIVATYVFWIHHEEVRGEYDWRGQRSLRDFLKLCHELGLCAFVRMGPWSHGEVRNGGFPDWLQKPDTQAVQESAAAAAGAGTMGALQLVLPNKLRTADPDFLKLAAAHYREIAAQMKGLLWKDGGPVVAVQFDNESNDLPYLFAQLITRLEVDDQHWFFFTANEGIVPEFGFADEKLRHCKQGPGIALTRRNRNGAKVNFVVLSPELALQFWKLPLAGRNRVVLSPNALLPDSENQVRLETLGGEAPQFAVFPELTGVRLDDRAFPGQKCSSVSSFLLSSTRARAEGRTPLSALKNAI